MKAKLQILILLLFSSFIGMSQTGPGEIDNSFNFSGVGPFGGAVPGNAAYPQPNEDGIVYKTDVYGPSSPNKDKIIIIGRFTSYNGVAREYIARINADGTLDATWVGPNTSAGYLYCVKILPDDKILIGGSFVVGNYRNIARLNADGTVDTTFNSSAVGIRGTNAEVHALTVVNGGKIYIGGEFSSYTGSTGRMFRLNADGTRDTGFNVASEINGGIRAIAIQKIGSNTNKVLVGGFFDAGTTPKYGRLVRLMSNGAFDSSFNSGGRGVTGGSAVFDLVVTPNDFIFAVGKFSFYNLVVRNSFVKLTPDGGVDANNRVGVANGQTIFAIKQQPDGKLLIGGNFTSYNNNASLPSAATTIPKGIARLTTLCVLDGTFLTGTGFQGGTGVYEGVSVVRDIVQQSDTKIIVAGDYTIYDGVSRRMLTRIKTRECAVAAVYNGVTLGWSNGITPDNSNYYMAIASGTYTIPTGTHMTVCELEVKAGATLLIQPNASLTVNGVVMNNGTFRIESTGSLVQVKEDPNADQGAGVFTMKRQTTPVNRFDYTYWSSPVEEQLLYDFSPNTLSDKYFSFNTNLGWQNIFNGAGLMVPGRGYIVRAPQTSSMIASEALPITLTFTGRVNNGQINVPIVKNGVKVWNLIGNPYPSAINANVFLSNTDNDDVIGGTIYLWTHNTALNPNMQIYQYTSNDYMVYNKSGSTLVKPTGVDFDGYITAGQGFFVEGIANGSVKFLNSMRVAGNGVNNQFLRVAQNQVAQNDVREVGASDKNRLWLNLTNANGAFKQTLVGYIEGATNGIDRSYDGAALNGNTFVNLYSIAEGQNLAIQGRAMPFSAEQTIPLGFSTTVAGTFNISLAKFDGLFQSQNVYLLDKLTATMQQIKGASYTFTTAVGTFNSRFELHFTDGMDAMKSNSITASDVLAIKEGKEISIKSTMTIKEASVYDISGKLLYHNTNVDSLEMITNNLNIQSGVAIIRMKMENNQEITKKIMVD